MFVKISERDKRFTKKKSASMSRAIHYDPHLLCSPFYQELPLYAEALHSLDLINT